MKYFVVILAMCFCLIVKADQKIVSTTDSKKSLKDAFLSAIDVANSENLSVQRELLLQAVEVNSQAIGLLFPTLSGSLTSLYQASTGSILGNTISPSSQTNLKFTATQPLFRGFRDFAALRQKKFLEGAQVYAILNLARQLFYDVSTAYYNVLGYIEDEKNYNQQIEVNKKRLKELEGFYKIGRSQLTDVLTFKANIASLEGQLEVTRGQLEVAKEILAFVTGWDRNISLLDQEPEVKNSESVEVYLSKLEDRADIQNAVLNAQASHEGVAIAWGQHLPSVDLIGDYYPARSGALQDVNWDVQLALTLPIFQGGVVQSQVRQARSVSSQSSLILSQARRTAEQEIRIFYDNLVADRRQLFKLSELVKVSKENADTEVKYYRNGLVTNLEVLQAITTYQDAQRLLDHQKYKVKMDATKLAAATGQRPEINIKINNGN